MIKPFKFYKLTKKTMLKSEHQTFDSPSQQRKKHIFHDVLEYIFIITVSLSATFAALLSFSDQLRAYF